MRYTVQYLPLNRIRAGLSTSVTRRFHELCKAAQDCMYVMIVRKNKKDGGYVVVSGHSHLEFFKKYTNKKYVPCLVDESKLVTGASNLLYRFYRRKLPAMITSMNPNRLRPASASILRTFLRQEPRFKQLSRKQQLKVLRMALLYKRTTLRSMKAKVEQYIKDRAG